MKQTALITGSYGGLGAAFAHMHAREGGDLILTDRNAQRLGQQKQQLEQTYPITVHTLAADLSDPQQVCEIHRFCLQNDLLPDYLICNAGFGGQGAFAARSMDKDLEMIAVNIRATTMLCKLFLPDMIGRGSGRVLLVSSLSALMPGPLQSVYFASKAYLTSLGNALWRELRGTGVTLTTLMPGILATDFAEKGHLEDTLLFSRRADVGMAAADGYTAMLRGRMNCFTGIPKALRAAAPLIPLIPKRITLNLIYALQQKETSVQMP